MFISSTHDGTLDDAMRPPYNDAPHSCFTLGRDQAVAGRYIIQEYLDNGSFAHVFAGYDTVLDSNVALKVFDVSGNQTAGVLGEARRAFRIKHENVVSVYDFGESNGVTYIVMERALCSLKKLKGIPVPLAEAAFIAEMAARGLHAAHQCDIIHRDVTLGNLLVVENSKRYLVKMSDFGLSKDRRLSVESSKLDQHGTPCTSPPEQWLAGKTIGSFSDVWGLASTIIWLLLGRPLFNVDYIDTRHLILEDSEAGFRRFLAEQLAPVPSAFRAILRTCLERDPERREWNAERVAEQFAQLHNFNDLCETSIWQHLAAVGPAR